MYPLLTQGLKLTIIGTTFVFISLFFLCLIIKMLSFFLKEGEIKEEETKDLDTDLVISASVAYFLEQSNDKIYIPKIYREDSNWLLESRINPITTEG
ncbi:MAG: OadG family protein [Nitrospinota bacterium]|nr:OadG family protein [Nitrospinota bacterium]